jgi:hypothetical protein
MISLHWYWLGRITNLVAFEVATRIFQIVQIMKDTFKVQQRYSDFILYLLNYIQIERLLEILK